MGEARRDALRVGFDRAIKLEFHGAKVSSDAGLFPYRDLDEAAQLTDSGAAELFDFRTGSNVQHGRRALLRQSVYRLLYWAILQRIRRFAALLPRAPPR